MIDGYKPGLRTGTYWGIRTYIADYQLADDLPAPLDQTIELAEFPTRVKGMDPAPQQHLINWGYAVCDAGVRRHVYPSLSVQMGCPYPGCVGPSWEVTGGA